MRWESKDRYYVATIETDLLGDQVLTKYWGGLGNRLGGSATVAVGMDAIEAELARIMRERVAHGYRLVTGTSSHFQQPMRDVTVNTSCMKRSPERPRSTANAIQQTLEARKSTNPHPEKRELRARTRAPRAPSMLPDHSRIDESNMVTPQLFLPFVA